MSPKLYKMRSLGVANGKKTSLELEIEFEGERVFVVYDSVRLGGFRLKARIEIDPKRLKRVRSKRWDYRYRGHLLLPSPQDN